MMGELEWAMRQSGQPAVESRGKEAHSMRRPARCSPAARAVPAKLRPTPPPSSSMIARGDRECDCSPNMIARGGGGGGGGGAGWRSCAGSSPPAWRRPAPPPARRGARDPLPQPGSGPAMSGPRSRRGEGRRATARGPARPGPDSGPGPGPSAGPVHGRHRLGPTCRPLDQNNLQPAT